MKVLGIESTAHTFGVGIYDAQEDKIIANQKAFYKTPPGQGMIPIVSQALDESQLKISEIDAISYSAGPGLGPCLQVGARMAAGLAEKAKKPLIAVHHGHAHLEVARWQAGFEDPLALYVSGGNTQIIISLKKSFFGPPFAVLGETLDIGVGNLFDALGRKLGLEFAHGSQVAKMAEKGNYHQMPYTVKGMNFAFSGLLTYASKQIGKIDANDLCYSLMETAFAELCEASERALLMSRKDEVIVCGGVAQNQALMQKMKMMAKMHGAKCETCESQYNADNGAMIALLGAREMQRKGKKAAIAPKDAWYEQKWRIDQLA
jgi:N6-L-threonylcarbamoyladenine synthase